VIQTESLSYRHFFPFYRFAVQLREGDEYTWYEGPSFRAATDYDGIGHATLGLSCSCVVL